MLTETVVVADKMSAETPVLVDMMSAESTQSKREKKKEGQDTRSPKATANAIDEDFAVWWAAYPRKQSKGSAARAYRAARKKASAEAISAGLAAYQFQSDPQFIPLPATWLNGERWADELTAMPEVDSEPDSRFDMATLGDPIVDDWKPWEHTPEENEAHRLERLAPVRDC